MIKGWRRKEILECCPDSREEELSSDIDSLESSINDIKNTLEQIDIDNLDKVQDAYRLLDDLADSLY